MIWLVSSVVPSNRLYVKETPVERRQPGNELTKGIIDLKAARLLQPM